MHKLETVLEEHLADWRLGWNIGSFGAIAEFHQGKAEAAIVAASLTRATARAARFASS